MPSIPSFREMPLWQRSIRLAVDAHNLIAQLPHSDKLGTMPALLDASLSIPVSLARGSKSGLKSFQQACIQAWLTTAEIETHLTILQQLHTDAPIDELFIQTTELSTTLKLMIERLTKTSAGRSTSAPDKPVA